MRYQASLAKRIAASAIVSASLASLLAASATSILVGLMLTAAEDQRLSEAAQILANELDSDDGTVSEIVADESEETAHTGIDFLVFDHTGKRLAGDMLFAPGKSNTCESRSRTNLRSCTVTSLGGLDVISFAPQSLPRSRFILAPLLAVLIAGLGAWLLSRPLAQRTIAPLSRLRFRLNVLDEHSPGALNLGEAENVLEVDQLRETISGLLNRLAKSREQASRFAANSAHELRTPLTTIQAELELLEEEKTLAPDIRKRLVTVHKKTIELNSLVERLLVLASLPAHKIITQEIVSLRDIVEDVTLECTVEDRRRITLPELDFLVQGDAVMLSTMVRNALGNALKYGEHAVLTIEKEAEFGTLRIMDDGPGVELSQSEQLFEPFVRADSARKARIPGTGLGLALIRHVAQVHGGSAEFQHTESGACLLVRLAKCQNI